VGHMKLNQSGHVAKSAAGHFGNTCCCYTEWIDEFTRGNAADIATDAPFPGWTEDATQPHLTIVSNKLRIDGVAVSSHAGRAGANANMCSADMIISMGSWSGHTLIVGGSYGRLQFWARNSDEATFDGYIMSVVDWENNVYSDIKVYAPDGLLYASGGLSADLDSINYALSIEDNVANEVIAYASGSPTASISDDNSEDYTGVYGAAQLFIRDTGGTCTGSITADNFAVETL